MCDSVHLCYAPPPPLICSDMLVCHATQHHIFAIISKAAQNKAVVWVRGVVSVHGVVWVSGVVFGCEVWVRGVAQSR